MTKIGEISTALASGHGGRSMPVQEMTGAQMGNELLWPGFCCHSNRYPELSDPHRLVILGEPRQHGRPRLGPDGSGSENMALLKELQQLYFLE